MHVNNNEIYDYLLECVPLGFPSQNVDHYILRF